MQRDYGPDIEQIRSALHHSTGSRASVMVGSGFSLNANARYSASSGFPIWNQITANFARLLYPHDIKARDEALGSAGAVGGALRLAQEVEAAFGRTVLLNTLRDMLPDREYEPSLVHEELLRLPWADVFTTNYDTLLERAALPLREQRYEVVRCIGDLPFKRAPRILKLHGTLPELRDAIVTEEDYRTYPERYSPFVAEVQVSMVESHLCLVGFSGDDPNFLAWTGWVRDRLGNQTLPVYLWTFEELSTFQTRLLEQRFVIPLPLTLITKQPRKKDALEAFLKMLRQPYEQARPRWCLPRHIDSEAQIHSNEPVVLRLAISAQDWLETALRWRESRRFYPGWAIPHAEAIADLWANTECYAQSINQNPDILAELDVPKRMFVLWEFLWRLRRSLIPTYDQIALHVFESANVAYREWRKSEKSREIEISVDEQSETITLSELDRASMELQLECLRHSREVGDFLRFDEIKNSIDKFTTHMEEDRKLAARNFVTYEMALAARSQWDDTNLTELLAKWDTSSMPLWALRRACLLIESGDRATGEKLLSQCLKELRAMADVGTPETWSIESWVLFHLKTLDQMRGFGLTRPVVPRKTISEDTSDATTQPMPQSPISSTSDFGTRQSRNDSELANLEGDHSPDHRLDYELSWLRSRSCDPAELYRWVEEQNSREFRQQAVTGQMGFDARRWRTISYYGNESLNQRLVASYRALRLVEEAGIPLRFGHAGSLAEKAIRFLAESDAPEATGAVLRLRNEKLIDLWFSRQRIATLPEEELRRLTKLSLMCIERLAAKPIDVDSDERGHFLAAVELLSRVSIRLGDPELIDIFRSIVALLPVLKSANQFWWIDPYLRTVGRICKSLTAAGLSEVLPDLLCFPILELPNHFSLLTDPLKSLDLRVMGRSLTATSKLKTQIDFAILRVIEIGADRLRENERRWLVSRLATLADRGLLSDRQLTDYGNAIFASRSSKDHFPMATGCLDTLVQLVPRRPGWDERECFRTKYLTVEWPKDEGWLFRTLDVFARSGPLRAPEIDSRKRGIQWSGADIRLIVKKCFDESVAYGERVAQDPLNNFPLSEFPQHGITNTERAVWFFDRVATVLEYVILGRKTVAKDVWSTLLDIVDIAAKVQLPLLSIYPKLAAIDDQWLRKLETEIISRISSNDDKLLTAGCHALVIWASQLGEPRIPKISPQVLSAIVGQLMGSYSRRLIHVFDTAKNLVDGLPHEDSIAFVTDSNDCLSHWGQRLRYSSLDLSRDSDRLLRGELPDLRVSFTGLCISIEKISASTVFAASWLQHVAEDSMPEIRQIILRDTVK